MKRVWMAWAGLLTIGVGLTFAEGLMPSGADSVAAFLDSQPAEAGVASPEGLGVMRAEPVNFLEYDPAAAPRYVTPGEMKAEVKSMAWRKGDFTVIPYGSLWGSAIYETERTFPGPYTLYVYPENVEGDESFVIDTRRTRLGLDIGGPSIPMLACAKSGGKVEIDFHGSFVIENKPGVLLRHAYGEVKNDDFRLLAGQTSDVISPLTPGTLSYSVGWCGGNIGYRRAQIRLELYRAWSDRLLWTTQGSINQNIISDLSSVSGVRAESTGWPVMEGRIAATIGERGAGCLPVTVGVSAHVGEQGFDFLTVGPPPLNVPAKNDARLPTWSLNADLYLPITAQFGVQGEFFTGNNLSTFLGGINQGVSLETRDTIRSTGGWFDLWYDWTPRLHSRTGYGVDDPFDEDLITGRCYNQYLYANTSFDVIKQLTVGVEVTYWKTLYTESRPGLPQLTPGESLQVEFTGKYGF